MSYDQLNDDFTGTHQLQANLAADRRRFSAWVEWSSKSEDKLQIRRRLAAGALGLLTLAGVTGYKSAVGFEEAASEVSVSQGLEAAGYAGFALLFMSGSSLLTYANYRVQHPSTSSKRVKNSQHENYEHQATSQASGSI